MKEHDFSDFMINPAKEKIEKAFTEAVKKANKELDMRTWKMCGNKHLMHGIGGNECPKCEQYFLHDLTEEINAIIKDTQDKADLYWRKLMNSGKGMYELGRKETIEEVMEEVEKDAIEWLNKAGKSHNSQEVEGYLALFDIKSKLEEMKHGK